jgi:hypothetical protein
MSSPAEQTVIVPADGLGTGRAQLVSRAPLTFAYLEKRLRDLSFQENGSRYPDTLLPHIERDFQA